MLYYIISKLLILTISLLLTRFSKIFNEPVSLYQFLYSGIYEEKSLYEELKSEKLKSNEFELKELKSIKLKKFIS